MCSARGHCAVSKAAGSCNVAEITMKRDKRATIASLWVSGDRSTPNTHLQLQSIERFSSVFVAPVPQRGLSFGRQIHREMAGRAVVTSEVCVKSSVWCARVIESCGIERVCVGPDPSTACPSTLSILGEADRLIRSLRCVETCRRLAIPPIPPPSHPLLQPPARANALSTCSHGWNGMN